MSLLAKRTSSDALELQLQSSPTIHKMQDWDAEYATGRILLLSQLPGWSIEKYAILQIVATYSPTIATLETIIEKVESMEAILLPEGGGYLEVSGVWKGNTNEVLNYLLQEGLVRKGVPDLSWRQTDAVDVWDFDEVVFSEESITLSETGQSEWCWIERNVLNMPLSRSTLLGGRTLFISSSPPFFSNGCFFSQICGNRTICELAKNDDVAIITNNGCECGIITNWRPDWWRPPQRGFFIWCRNDGVPEYGS